MRHLVKGRKLGRTASHRKATFMALSVALIKSERIITTLAKAKALRSHIEPIITRAKEDSTHNRSHVFRHLRDKQATSRLFDEIGPMVADRPGGYTRIIKLGIRPGDGAEKALIELVDFNEVQPDTSRKKKRRTRRAGSGKKSTAKTAEINEQSVDNNPDKPEVTVAIENPEKVTQSVVTDENNDVAKISEEKSGDMSDSVGIKDADSSMNTETKDVIAAEKDEEVRKKS